MTKRLLLINPAQHREQSASSVPLFTVPPAGLARLAAMTPSDWEVRIADENTEPFTFEEADLVGVTSMTSNAPRAYEICSIYRQKRIKTVMGGVHATVLPDEAMLFADSVVKGEAEYVWHKLLLDFEKNELGRFYEGDRICLENLARSRHDLHSDRYRLRASVETARGCPNNCDFCSVSTINGRGYRQRPVEEVLDELESLPFKEFLFSDDNLIGYGKSAEERAIRLFRGMIERGLNKRWAAQVGIDFANNPEVLKYAKKAGCVVVLIGFESVNEETLLGMHKARNLKVGVRNYKEVIKRIHHYGIAVDGAFVFGGDGDKEDVFARTTDFILDAKIDMEQLTVLTPLPGTRLYSRLRNEGRLLRMSYPHDWKHYDFFEAVFRPNHMTPDELEEGVHQVYGSITSRKSSLKRALNSLIHARTMYGAAIAYTWNREIGSLWRRKYDTKKNELPSADNQLYLSPVTTEEERSEADLTSSGQGLTKATSC